jgi:hypothetical protein
MPDDNACIIFSCDYGLHEKALRAPGIIAAPQKLALSLFRRTIFMPQDGHVIVFN